MCAAGFNYFTVQIRHRQKVADDDNVYERRQKIKSVREFKLPANKCKGTDNVWQMKCVTKSHKTLQMAAALLPIDNTRARRQSAVRPD